jgi:uncharacterized NAD(P)/FAD-binding protein YdhS
MQYSSSIAVSDLQFIELNTVKCYDVAIIGAGISATFTLIHYLTSLEQHFLHKEYPNRSGSKEIDQITLPVEILVTEKSGQFWTGIPYGDRSGQNPLLISSLREFIPQQLERESFKTWLTQNRDWVFDPAKYLNCELASQWLQANTDQIAQGNWDELFLPRHAFGLYLKQRMDNLLAAAVAKGLIEYDLITAEVLDIQRDRDLYQIEIAAEVKNKFLAKQVVLAIGSPPNLPFEGDRASDKRPDVCYIDNMYEPSVDVNIDRICRSLQQSDLQSPRQVLIIGSNAGTLDTLYSLNNSQLATSLIDKFVVISPTATFPHRISREVIRSIYSPQHLVALVQAESFTAKQILGAVQQDVDRAAAQSINISDIYTDISKVVMQALNLLSFDEQKQFVSRYAVEIGKLQRRAGGEYLDVVKNLTDRHKLELIKGKFTRYFSLATGGYRCEYISSEDRERKICDAQISVIINCAGFQDVTKSSSLLIQNLIRREICTPNESNRGFVIDQNFEASKNFYLMGPLVAGNIDGNLRVWHAESCQRIISFSEQLAAVLLRLEQPAPADIVGSDLAEDVSILVNAV